jgi:asparagine synthase (glutamine-hydrolysing)
MCGIWGLFSDEGSECEYYYRAFKTLKSRGPDRSSFIEFNKPYNFILGFHRLSIMDPSSKGDQPFIVEYNDPSSGSIRTVYSICNGEIYNYRELAEEYGVKLKSGSDCEVIPELYVKLGIDKLTKILLGEFAFLIVDVDLEGRDMKIHAARDPFGIRPLFYTKTKKMVNFSSELKGLVNVHRRDQISNISDISPVKPGHYMTYIKQSRIEYVGCSMYYTCDKFSSWDETIDIKVIKDNIVSKLTEAVRCRLIADRPVGCLLSGGLDSSLVASIAAMLLKREGKKLRTFSIGMPGSTDEVYAEMVAKHIGSDHFHVSVNQDEWLGALNEVIYATETYDITTVRASTGQYLISKWIANHTDIKVLLIGDGSDELCSGYLYFHKAPDAITSHFENINLLENISYFDVLRSDRGISSNGLEARVPFLDTRFVDYYLSIDPKLRVPTNGLEKWLLRESFAETGLLPTCVLLKKKEAFSDSISGTGKSWYQIIQEYTNNLYTDTESEGKRHEYIHNMPPTKEALYYRELFEGFFGHGLDHIVPYYWLPKWCGNITEPSARVLDVYKHNIPMQAQLRL